MNRRKKEEEVKKFSNMEGANPPPGSGIDITPTKEPPKTLTITPSKTLINSLNHNPSDYFDDKLEKLTLNPIGHPQSLGVLPENLQTLNELPYSPLKAENLSTFHGDWKLPSVPDILAEFTPPRRSEITPSKGTLPGVDSFDHIEPSKKVLNLAATFENEMSKLSHEERKVFCLKIASNWEAKLTQNTSELKEDLSVKTYFKTTEKDDEMAKEGPKQEGFGCPLCLKSFNRLSTLKYVYHSSIKPYTMDNNICEN